jgi:cyclic lactone autoinducer peptide
MKIKLHKILVGLSTFAASLATFVAVRSLSSTCLFLTYQPAIPKELIPEDT